MAYKIATTNWKFTAPQEGEVDSAEKVAAMLQEIDDAIPTPDVLAQLTSRGNKPAEITDATFVLDNNYNPPRWVTNLHSHPLPTRVPYAEAAGTANSAKKADAATTANRLVNSFSINGKSTNGTQNVTIRLDDISDASRVFYGTSEPKNYRFTKALRDRDIYVKIS